MGAFATGNANSFADLLTAVKNHMIANGWANPGGAGILTKGTLVVKFAATAGTFTAHPATGVLGDNSDTTGKSGNILMMASIPRIPMSFPITYDLHVNNDPDEVYIVINYNGSMYQHLNFGKTDIPNVGGTGMWGTASMRSDINITDVNYCKVHLSVSPSQIGTFHSGLALGYSIESNTGYRTTHMHMQLDSASADWRYKGAVGDAMSIAEMDSWMASLLMVIPSDFNQSTVLLPIDILCNRGSNLRTVVASMRNARYTRIDNHAAGEVIQYGPDKWKLYPLYSRNVAVRNGVNWATGADHSGTLAVAIRYFGP